MKKVCLTLIVFISGMSLLAQVNNPANKTTSKKEAKKQKINNLIRQAEEGVLVYHKQSAVGLQFRTSGYGFFYEMGRMKTNRRTSIYRFDFTEIKNQKEDKTTGAGFPFGGNPYVFGKLNNFYQATLGFGQQVILGQKGNKNGVAVTAVYTGGLSLGLLKPYYLQVQDPADGQTKTIKYSQKDSSLFLGQTILGAGGPFKGWGEVKVKPGVFAKIGTRFDYGRFNETLQALEVGLSAEFYSAKIPIMAKQKDKQFFFQGYISLMFGRRK